MSNPSSGNRKRVLSGMRPTGKLHLGNYMGALHNWVRLQHEYECYFFIADWHALTTDYADPSQIGQNIREVALDWLGAGLDPEKCTLFVQSHVPQHAELHLLLSMITPLGWLERVPTYKDQQENLTNKDLSTYGFLGYPLLQSADILIYQADLVPVGQDQVAHVELTREVARRFNQFYPRQIRALFNVGEMVAVDLPPILPEPQVLLTPSPKLPGTDGRKMSKSYGNTIMLTDSHATVSEKLRGMYNGGQRALLSDPGDPDICPVAELHEIFSDQTTNLRIRDGCKTATVSCTQCKQFATSSIWGKLEEIQANRSHYELNPHKVDAILAEGAKKASDAAEKTMQEVRAAMGLSGVYHNRLTVFEHLQEIPQHRTIHNLSNKKDWWDLPSTDRGKLLREYWKTSMIPTEVRLKPIEDRVFITPRNKRILAPTSREMTEGEYVFNVRNKSYEILALLAWDGALKLRAFMIPQKAYRTQWSRIPKAEKRFNIHLRHVGSKYFLYLPIPDAEPIDVTSYEGDFSFLQ